MSGARADDIFFDGGKLRQQITNIGRTLNPTLPGLS